MKCFDHPTVDAVGVCTRCGKAACGDHIKEVSGVLVCDSCASQPPPKHAEPPNMAAEAGKAAGAAVVGGAAGYGVVAATGMTAAGMVGSGAGAGSAAGPIGMALGAIVGLAAYGIYRVVTK